jgi:hypothetical protein
MNPSPWRNSRVLLTLALVFLCGAMSGALWMKMTSVAAAPPAAPAWNKGGKEVTVERFKRELNLNAKQTAELELVLDDFMKYYQTLQEQMDDVRGSGKQRILSVLDDSQKERFQKLMNELQKQQIR